MNRIIILILTVFSPLISCKDSKDSNFIDEEFKRIKAEYKNNQSLNYLSSELYKLYKIGKSQPSKNTRAQIFAMAGELAAKNKLDGLSTILNTLSLLTDINKEGTAENIFQLSKAFASKNKNQEADLLLNIIITEFPGTVQADKSVKILQNNFFSPEEFMVNLVNDSSSLSNLKLLTSHAIAYATALSGNERAGYFLYTAAERLRGAGDIYGALILYDMVYTSFKDSPYGPLSVFISGFLSDTSLNDPVTAETFFTEFIKNYPEHHLADDAKFLLENIGKKDEEIIRNLKLTSSDRNSTSQ